MKNQQKRKEILGKPKRRDFGFNRFFNPQKSATYAMRHLGTNAPIRLGTKEREALPIREFIPHRGMNRKQRRTSFKDK